MINKVMFWLTLFAVLVDIVIWIGNVFGTHTRDLKGRLFIGAITFAILATASDAMWYSWAGAREIAVLAKGITFSVMTFGLFAEVFIFYYIVAFIHEKYNRGVFGAYIVTWIAIAGIIFLIWGAMSGVVLVYSNGHMYHGPQFNTFLHLYLLVGAYMLGYILFYSRLLKIKNTLILISFYVLPLYSLYYQIKGGGVSFTLPALAISLLIINNLLANGEIRKAEVEKLEAETGEKNKMQFLANMSHEIRTPINAVLGLNEMIIRESHEPEIIAYANDIKGAGNSLLNTINDVLDFSKIDSGKMELVEVEYDIPTMLNDLSNMIVVKCNDKGLSFELDVDESIPTVLYGDLAKIKQTITNLLSNGAKYTTVGYVKLKVGYEKLDEERIELQIAVEDTGLGLMPDDLEKLFTPFIRVDEKNTMKEVGTGLGLSIARSFLRLMDSDINVQSVYGSGTTFSFNIAQKVVDWKEIGPYREAFEKIRHKKDKYEASFQAPNARVLVVDDMPMNLTVFKGLLKKTLVQVVTATSGAEALEHMRKERFDMIFMDHMMPTMDGVETLLRAKEDKGIDIKDTPVIALTANAMSGAREEYIDAGFTDYLAKPINPAQLEESLVKHLPADLLLMVELGEEDETQQTEAQQAESLSVTREIKADTDVEELTFASELDALKNDPYINVEDGMEISGGEEIYLIAAQEFVYAIDEDSAKIEKYWKANNLHDYVVLVHGLKSASKLMGDNELSEMARELEFAGKEENLELINEKTQALLDRYRIHKKYLRNSFQ